MAASSALTIGIKRSGALVASPRPAAAIRQRVLAARGNLSPTLACQRLR